ncbi:methylthioribulose 1-phosphate dehydratase [Streptomyces sp. DSM 44915]|uniref:Methylthioribulose-1-phosphate dehydratase n=1 Tax=Streptomyces chisholmiae TaxID=3075540 RepID=A0ABU2JWT4_9ACTN|nr:methylthioribulose 1-phosphate dehydratase [Streptomyces sp. DSM 44915]MDT0269460.1 methylthioribulose 1-phosphate dehydratase [Streptomyces sp. DSM 44915]
MSGPQPNRPSDTALAAAAGRELATFSRVLYERGWMPGTSGNLSRRGDGARRDVALITASGLAKGELTADDMVAVHAETGVGLRPGAPRPSAETVIHAAIYQATDAAAVIHVHSPHATAVACRYADRGRPGTLPLERFELLKGLGLADPSRAEVPVFPNWPQVARIADEVAEFLKGADRPPPGLLIADHGITVWGASLAQARDRLECFEAIAQLITLGVPPAGGPAPRSSPALTAPTFPGPARAAAPTSRNGHRHDQHD